MARRDDQREGREVGPKSLENFAENFFFAAMRAAAEENRPIAVDPESPQNLPGQVGIQRSSLPDRT